jgi:predicted Fe-Mo cluster-binding NifX family protein
MSRLKIEDARSKRSAKIAIASSGKDLDSPVDPRFGRCPYFLIVETGKNGEFETVPNTAVQAFRGAGISAAQMVVNKKAEAVIAGNFGPKAVAVLSSSGIKTFRASGIEVREAVEKFKDGELKEVTQMSGPFGPGMGFGRGRDYGRCGSRRGG